MRQLAIDTSEYPQLRIAGKPPTQCLLLLPGSTQVPELETDEFFLANGVGAISEFNVGMEGIERLRKILGLWLEAKDEYL